MSDAAVERFPDASEAWLARVRELQAIAQEGLTYARNPFDAGRYARLKAVTADIASALEAGGEPGRCAWRSRAPRAT